MATFNDWYYSHSHDALTNAAGQMISYHGIQQGTSLSMCAVPGIGPYYEEKQETKKGGIMREYFNKHKDFIFTVLLVIVLDHLVFGGAFREKLKAIVQKILDKTEKKFHNEIDN